MRKGYNHKLKYVGKYNETCEDYFKLINIQIVDFDNTNKNTFIMYRYSENDRYYYSYDIRTGLQIDMGYTVREMINNSVDKINKNTQKLGYSFFEFINSMGKLNDINLIN